jgi:hypothetical protein
MKMSGSLHLASVINLSLSAPILYDYLTDKASKEQTSALWPTLSVKTLDGKPHTFIGYYCNAFLNEYKDVAIAVENIKRFRQIVIEIKKARLLKFLQNNCIQRVQDDLDRAFYRTLFELRKHQH